MPSLTTVVITATEITQTGYSRIDRPILHPTGCMPWFILHLWGFLWVREARCRGYKITGLPQKILHYYFNIVVTFTLHSWLLQVLFSVIKSYVCRPFFQVILTAALFGKFRFGFQKYFLLLQVSFNISTLAHCTKGNFFPSRHSWPTNYWRQGQMVCRGLGTCCLPSFWFTIKDLQRTLDWCWLWTKLDIWRRRNHP